MRRRRALRVVAAGTVPLAGCSVLGNDGSDDEEGGFSCPPVDRSEAASLIEAAESDRFDISGNVHETYDAQYADGRDVPGAIATFAGPDDFPYEVTIPIWDDESAAAEYATEVDASVTHWAGEPVDLETGLKARIEDVTVIVQTIRAEHRQELQELFGAIPCVTDDDVTATSWD